MLCAVGFSQGIEVHQIVGVPVRIYGVAKTIVDCFKFRNQIGSRPAVEALREAWREKKVTAEDLYRYARTCRVLHVMRPYLEGGWIEGERPERCRVGQNGCQS